MKEVSLAAAVRPKPHLCFTISPCAYVAFRPHPSKADLDVWLGGFGGRWFELYISVFHPFVRSKFQIILPIFSLWLRPLKIVLYHRLRDLIQQLDAVLHAKQITGSPASLGLLDAVVFRGAVPQTLGMMMAHCTLSKNILSKGEYLGRFSRAGSVLCMMGFVALEGKESGSRVCSGSIVERRSLRT